MSENNERKNETMQSAESTQNTESVQSAESAQSIGGVQNVETVKNAETLQSAPKEQKTKQGKKGSGNGAVIGLLAVAVVMLAALIIMLAVVLKKDSKNNERIDELASAVNSVQVSTGEYKQSLSEINEQMAVLTNFSARLSSMMGEEEGGAVSENDVVIGGEYTILSTEEISDAYKAGDLSTLDATQKKTAELASEVIDEVIEDGMTDYEKELAIYEWMCKNIKHDDGITVAIPTTGEYADNPGGVLSTHKAVCVGFATTFRLFMQMLDIECMVVHDTYLSHSWDLVKIDGDWYHTDIYMDAESTLYANFNMTDGMCANSHDWDMNFFPNATSTQYCYAVANSVELTSLEDAAKAIRDLAEAGESGTIFYKMSGEDSYIRYQQMELMMSEIDAYITNSEISDTGYLYWNADMIDTDTVIYQVNFESYYYDDDDPYEYDDLDDDDIGEAYDAVEEVFKDFYDVHENYDYDYDYDYNYDDYWGDWE